MRRPLILLTCGLLAATAASCSAEPTSAPLPAPVSASATPTPTSAATPTPSAAATTLPRGLTPPQRRVDRTDASSVADAFVLRLELWDTRIDQRPGDAAGRAARYATDELAQAMLGVTPSAAPGTRWQDLVEHDGYTTATTEVGGLGPARDHDRAGRAVTVSQIDHGVHDWQSRPTTGPTTYLVQLQRTAHNRWVVTNFHIPY